MSSIHQVDALSEKKTSSDDHVASSLYYDDDGIHDGLESPTEEELRTLRRVSDKIPWSAYSTCLVSLCYRRQILSQISVVTFVEVTERFSTIGSSVVFVSMNSTENYRN